MIPPITVKPGYRSQSEDTSVESDAVQFYLLRQRTNAQRWAMSSKLTKGAKSGSLFGIRRTGRTEQDIRVCFAQAVLGEKWNSNLVPVGDNETLWIQDSSELARQLHPILESLQIPYYITGGVAAYTYGEPRTTRDLDLVIQIDRSDIVRVAQALEVEGFYCPPGAVEDIQAGRGRVLSVTQIETILNADIVINADTEFDRLKMQRRRLVQVDAQTCVWMCSPEDLILAKLLWGRRSQSEKQWRDVLGVLKVQLETLDYGYLADWAEQLDLLDDLQRAFTEAGI